MPTRNHVNSNQLKQYTSAYRIQQRQFSEVILELRKSLSVLLLFSERGTKLNFFEQGRLRYTLINHLAIFGQSVFERLSQLGLDSGFPGVHPWRFSFYLSLNGDVLHGLLDCGGLFTSYQFALTSLTRSKPTPTCYKARTYILCLRIFEYTQFSRLFVDLTIWDLSMLITTAKN